MRQLQLLAGTLRCRVCHHAAPACSPCNTLRCRDAHCTAPPLPPLHRTGPTLPTAHAGAAAAAGAGAVGAAARGSSSTVASGGAHFLRPSASVRPSSNSLSSASSVLGCAGPVPAAAGRRGFGRMASLLSGGAQAPGSAGALGGLSTQASSVSQLSSMRSTVSAGARMPGIPPGGAWRQGALHSWAWAGRPWQRHPQPAGPAAPLVPAACPATRAVTRRS
jgi:hypothetical protein